jgi:hypothetical protein
MNEQISPPRPKRWKRILVVVACALPVTAAGVFWPEITLWVASRQPMPMDVAAVAPALPLPAPPPNADLVQLKEELLNLKNHPAETGKSADIKSLEDRLTLLEKNTVEATSVLKLMERLSRLEDQTRELQSHRKADAALVLAVGLLKEAVDRGAPFDGELRALKALAPEDKDVAKLVSDLKGRAAAGIPTRSVLLRRFAKLEAEIIRADTLPTAALSVGDTWQRRVVERLLMLFTLRREDGEVAGNTAVAQLDGLSGEAAKAAQLWTNDAHARLEADQAIGELAADAVAQAGAKL